MLSHLLLWGNSYSQIIRSGRSSIVGLYPLMSDHMEVDRDASGKLTYTYTTTEGKTVQIRPEDILYIPGLGFDGSMGYSLIVLEKNETVPEPVRLAVLLMVSHYYENRDNPDKQIYVTMRMAFQNLLYPYRDPEKMF